MTDLHAELLASFEGERDEHLAVMRAMLAVAERQGFDAPEFDVEDVYRRAHSLKGAARAVDLVAVEAVAHRLETLLDGLYAGGLAWDERILRVVRRALDAIEDLSAAEIRGAEADPGEPLGALDALLRDHGLEVPAPSVPASEPRRTAAAAPAAQLRIESAALDSLLHTTLALLSEMSRHDRLAADLRELCVVAQKVPQRAAGLCAQLASRFETRAWRMGRLAAALQDDLQRVRLLPVEAALGHFPRMVRELARELGKDIEVDVRGFDVQADRAIVQGVADAILHLLRNAVGHGIELPHERAAAGKDPVGRIALHASLAGGRLLLCVEDDGRGLDERAIASRAVQAGIIAPDVPVAPHDLIFHPGLSTAAAVSDLSGRGMGMPVVRQVVSRLNGTVTVSSRPGWGTRFELSLPFSLVSQRLLVIEADEQSYALPASAVASVEAVPAEAVFEVEGRPRVRIGDADIPLVWLRSILGLPPRAASPLQIAVLRQGDGRFALVVDALSLAEDWPVGALPPGLEHHPLLAGLIGMADGSIAFVLGVPALTAAAVAPQGAPPLAPRPKRAEPPLILVVDDSVTTRSLERSILEAHGYRVLVSVNGREALERLATHQVDLVISDVEMPLMDGFALLKSIKADPRLSRLPVILVTSRENPEDRARGLHLGADAYIVKRHFSQEDLLETIQQLLP